MVSFGSQSQKQESKSVSTPVKEMMWTPQQEEMAYKVSDYIKPYLNWGSQVPTYPKQMYVSRTPEEEAYFGMAKGDVPEYMKPRVGALDTVLSGRPSTDINANTTEQYYQQYVKDPYVREFEQTYLPKLKESFVGPGYYGSRRAEEESRARENLAYKLASERANLYYQDEQKRRELMESAANRQASTALPAYITEANIVANVGALSRQIEQERAQADFARWLSGETVDGVTPHQYNPFMQAAFSFLNYFPYQLGQQSTETSRGTDSGFKFGVSLAGLPGSNTGGK